MTPTPPAAPSDEDEMVKWCEDAAQEFPYADEIAIRIKSLLAANARLKADAARFVALAACISGIHIEPGARDTGIHTFALQITESMPTMTDGYLTPDKVRAAVDVWMAENYNDETLAAISLCDAALSPHNEAGK